MKCPADGTTLVMADRQGVEIDYCPTCRGIWLDRGELDKIMDRAAATPAAEAQVTLREPGTQPPSPRREAPRRPAQDEPRHWDGDHDDDDRRPRRKRRDSFLSELFDF